MNKQLLFSLSFFFFCLPFSAQESIKLTGTVIGTQKCVDYDNNNRITTTVNTAANLFDGKLNTYFATYERSYTWAGLDLGEKHVITEVSYCPRKNHPNRTLLGLFEGANDPNFMDAIPLFLIDEQPQENMLTKQGISCSRGFRYVRYVGPDDTRCNIAELEFHGYKSEGNDDQLMQLTNLPTITIHTKNAQEIKDKEVYIEGIVSIISEDGKEFFSAPLEIRGRGNNSWTHPKKPYRMKLKEKASLLGCPAKEKSWTLINNYGDKTLMRNLLAFDLSRRFNMEYTSVGIPVDVILNGEYKGCYQLCDQIQVAKERVDIDKKTGTFLEIDAYAENEPVDEWFKTTYYGQIPVTIKHPEDDDLAKQFNNIKSHFEKMVSSAYATNFKDPTNGFRKYIDVESFLRHFLIGEIAGNTDTYWSVYMYRKDGSNDRYYTGPVWDFDIAYENDNRTYPINNNQSWIYNSTGSAANGMRNFVNRLMQDNQFTERMKAIYAQYRDNEVITTDNLIEVVDYYEEEITRSARLNFMRWDILNEYIHQNFQALGSYEAEVDFVRGYIKKRIEWMDNKLSYVPTSIKENRTASTIQIIAEKGNVSTKGIDQKVSIRIYHIHGWEIVNTQTDSDMTIQLNKGSYIIQIDSPNAKRQTTKFIIQ